jgi:hypothetical protein
MVEIVELDLARTRAYPAVLLTGSSAACAAAGAPPVRSAFSASAKKLPAVTIKIRFIPPTVFSLALQVVWPQHMTRTHAVNRREG